MLLTNGGSGGEKDGLGLSLTEYSSPLVAHTLLLFRAFLFQLLCGNNLTAKLVWIK